MSSLDLMDILIEPQTVAECLKKLGKDISDGSLVSSNMLLLASPVLSSFVAELFTAILCHGYMPDRLRDCTLVPIPTLSDSYKRIAMAPNLSTVPKRSILVYFGCSFVTSDLQFGFKPGFSTELCTVMLFPNTFTVIHDYLTEKEAILTLS